jgi:hypothetical protein
MATQKENNKSSKVEEPRAIYEVSKIKGIDKDTFDFDAEFENGFTPEEFKTEMHKRINTYPWKK